MLRSLRSVGGPSALTLLVTGIYLTMTLTLSRNTRTAIALGVILLMTVKPEASAAVAILGVSMVRTLAQASYQGMLMV